MSRSIVPDLADFEVWFLTGSQGLYGEDTLRQVAEQSQTIARMLDEAGDIPVRVVWKPVLTDSASIRRAAIEANASATHNAAAGPVACHATGQCAQRIAMMNAALSAASSSSIARLMIMLRWRAT